jgi:hypothetical protein
MFLPKSTTPLAEAQLDSRERHQSRFHLNAAVYQATLVVGVMLIAALLRFYKLGDWSFWIDEITTVNNSLGIFTSVGKRELILRAPLSYFLTYFVMTFWQMNEWGSRLIPAMIGTLSIPILYFPIRRLLGGAVALGAIILLAISPWHIYWSQNARYVVPLILLYTLAMFAFYFALEEDRPWYMLASIVLLGLAARERPFSLIFVPIVVSYVVLLKILPFGTPRGLNLKNLAIFSLPALLPALLFSPLVLEEVRRVLTFVGRINNTPFSVLEKYTHFVRGAVIALGSFAIIHLIVERKRAILFLGLCAVIPTIMLPITALYQKTAPHYAITALIPWFILASWGASVLLLKTKGTIRTLVVVSMVIALFYYSAQNVQYYRGLSGYYWPDWKGTFAWVKERKQIDDLVLTTDWREPLARYYLGEDVMEMDEIDPDDVAVHNRKLWIVELKVRAEPQWQGWIESQCQLVLESTEISTYSCEPNPFP